MTVYPDDPRVAEAKAMPIQQVVDLLGLVNLKRTGHELVGPCPRCGGSDRFGVNLRKGLFQCRRCEAKGDGIALVMWDRQIDFPAALTWLCGSSEGITAAERAERIAKAAAASKRSEAYAEKKRREAIAAARAIWRQGLPSDGTPVTAYLARRGIVLTAVPRCLRFHPALPFTVRDAESKGWREIHRGPAMLAAVQQPNGQALAVHRTWLDLEQPKGKASIIDPATGASEQAKKVLGSKKGGAIRLTGDLKSETLVMGEGIETTLSAMVAGVYATAMFWAGVDLGNMAGQMARGPGLKHSGVPDLSDEQAFVPPPWVLRLIFVQDGDSDQKDTRAKLESGLRRAMALRPGLQGQIVAAPNGFDLNDVLMGAGNG